MNDLVQQVLPNLLVPGAGKSGTTSLHSYLGLHPDIYMSTVKEPAFFTNDAEYPRALREYSRLFVAGQFHLFRGESSTAYMLFSHVAAPRIAASNPEVRLIFLLRNPVDRAYSHYTWMKSLGLETRSFRAAFEADAEDEPDPRNSIGGNYRYYFSEGRYHHHISNFRAVFPSDQIAIIASEDLRNAPTLILNRCWEFLGLTPLDAVPSIRANATALVPRRPRLNAWLEGRAPGRWSGMTSAGLAKALRWVASSERGHALGQKARRVIAGRRPHEPLGLSERAWIAGWYRDDVRLLREDFGLRDAWNDDFPSDEGC